MLTHEEYFNHKISPAEREEMKKHKDLSMLLWQFYRKYEAEEMTGSRFRELVELVMVDYLNPRVKRLTKKRQRDQYLNARKVEELMMGKKLFATLRKNVILHYHNGGYTILDAVKEEEADAKKGDVCEVYFKLYYNVLFPNGDYLGLHPNQFLMYFENLHSKLPPICGEVKPTNIRIVELPENKRHLCTFKAYQFDLSNKLHARMLLEMSASKEWESEKQQIVNALREHCDFSLQEWLEAGHLVEAVPSKVFRVFNSEKSGYAQFKLSYSVRLTDDVSADGCLIDTKWDGWYPITYDRIKKEELFQSFKIVCKNEQKDV